MASREQLESRIASAQKNIDKKNALIAKMEARIQKNMTKLEKLGMEYNDNPYNLDRSHPNFEKAFNICWTISDAYDSIENANKSFKELNSKLAGYQEELNKLLAKENSRDIKVILDFLADWQKKSIQFYQESFERYLEAHTVRIASREEHYKAIEKLGWQKYHSEEAEIIRHEEKRQHDRFNATWNFIYPYIEKSTLNMDRLQRDIQREADRKYDWMIQRVNKIVGEITDASYLSVANNGELNGIICGTKGKCTVDTIGAGGYNIQRFHFRTLIKPWR